MKTTDLPVPALARWQPLRAGLVDLFYYDVEEFHFHDGRLLLRGNNGTGKSKVLALLLPFLLDGDLSPHRVEPDADGKKRMEWNLLLGGAHPHRERLGYTWLEFGRVDADGRAHYLTLGCGMKAVAGRGMVRHWFFVTPQRVGVDLSLMDATGTALTRDRLDVALEGAGLHDTARSYRSAVDEALFGLGEHRYGALVDLLVQLRQPQLSKRPSEKALSNALTEALTPMDQAVLADVAEAFRALQEDREALQDLQAASRSAEAFLGHYRRYAQAASRRRARAPRLAQSAYEHAGSDLREAQEVFHAAQAEVVAAEAEVERLELEGDRLAAHERALREAPEMRSADELARRATQVLERTDQLAARNDASARAEDRLRKARQRLVGADTRLASAAGHREAAVGNAHRVAVIALLERQHEQEIHQALAEAQVGAATVTQVREAAGRLIARRTAGIRHVESLLAALDTAARAEAQARAAAEQLQGEADELADVRSVADQARAEAAGDLHREAIEYVSRLTELRIEDPAALDADLTGWLETLDGPSPLDEALAAADLASAQALTGLRVTAEARREVLLEAAKTLRRELGELIEGRTVEPTRPHTRAPEARSGRLGAPLWRLVDFTGEVAAGDRAGIEAALEASGLLDAWVMPTGDLLEAGTEDVVLRASSVVEGAGLASLLRPAVDRGAGGDAGAAQVTDVVVEGVLGAIGLGAESSGETWVAPDGRFRLGVLHGQWRKAEAEYLGAGARESARRRRIADLEEQVRGIEGQIAAVTAELARIVARDVVRERERAAAPPDRALLEANREVADLVGRDLRLRQRRETADGEVRRTRDGTVASRAALEVGAQDVDLPSDPDELGRAREGLNDYRVAVGAVWPAVDAHRVALEQRTELVDDAEAAETDRVVAADAGRAAERLLAEAVEEERTLRETVGEAVEALQRRLAQAVDDVRRHRDEARRAAEARLSTHKLQALAQGRSESAAQALAAATEARLAAATAFQRFATTGLIGVALTDLALPSLDQAWAPDPAMRLARAIEKDLSEVAVDEPAWESAQRRLTDEFRVLGDVLSAQGSSASAQMLEEGVVVEVLFWGRPATVPELVERLRADVTERERVLDEREREVLENHLINEVASTLQELISDAEQQVARMNAELEERPTSTGMKLRMRWVPQEDGPAGLAEARRRLLRQSADAWSEEDRAAVGSFLQERIAEFRAAAPTGTWLEHLTEALDYRTWNRFVIERYQNEQWRSATGPSSGGEKVLAVSVPLFAAASSHYASAGNPHAPRLVMLDEAFAGVDDNARASYLGLLAAFDLDVVMTSEREWGCYPEVPGLAIAQLKRVDGINAVHVTNWRWDGVRRARQPRPEPLVSVHLPEPEAEPVLQGDLFR